MKKLHLLLAAFTILLSISGLSSCRKVIGDGPIVSEERTVGSFNVIRTALSADVIIEEGNSHSVVVEAQKNILDIIETRVSGDVLMLKVRDKLQLHRVDRITVYITIPKPEGIVVSGSGNVHAKGKFNCDDLHLEISGSGKIKLDDLLADELNARISGSGDIEIEQGKAKELELKISGSGKYRGAQFVTKTGEINVSGSGNAHIHVTDYLKVHISGSGNVSYYGSPEIDVKISGSGNLLRL